MTTEISLIAEIEILPGFEEEVKKGGVAMAVETQKETGCIQFLPYTRKDSPQTIVIYEVYQSEEAFQLHRSSAHAGKFFELLQGKVKNDKPAVVFLTELND